MIEENVKWLLENIDEIKQKHGIKRDITVVAATKYASLDDVKVLKNAGITSAGENRVQDFLKKYEAVPDMDWHFIGQLQTNKAKYIVDKVSLIHSVDRQTLAEEINKECFKKGLVGNILIEVNIAEEQSKGGILPDKLFGFAEELKGLKNLNPSGLMCVAPLTESPDKNRKYYLQMTEFYDTLNIKIFDGKFRFLSMGMSGDYAVAIECGANMIRPGSVIFGR